MRIAVVSDVHENRRAFDAVLKDLNEAALDMVAHGGDLAANGAHPAEIIDRIRDLGRPGILGNADAMLWIPERLAQLALQYPKISSKPSPRRTLDVNRTLGTISVHSLPALSHAESRGFWGCR